MTSGANQASSPVAWTRFHFKEGVIWVLNILTVRAEDQIIRRVLEIGLGRLETILLAAAVGADDDDDDGVAWVTKRTPTS
eukprot:1126118-Pelagomonas_calceolata.AAC.3